MPDTNENAHQTDADADDIRARFANVEQADTGTHIDLPPVPHVSYQRPPTPEEREAAAREKARESGARTFGGGVVGSASGDMKGSGQALTIGTGLVGSIVAGTFLGWLADKYLLHSGATPWGLIIGFFLGVVSGFINLVRVANRLNKD